MSKTDPSVKKLLSEVKNLDELQTILEAQAANLPLVNRVEDIVHGEGSIDSSIMMIGEAPGYHEALARKPFVGRSGQLLRQTIKELDLEIKNIFISNIIKVRPPINRDPSAQEISAFKPFLDREIELIQPKLIITLGRFSMAKFLENVKISQIHGRLQKLHWQNQDLFVLPMYHPAAALRSTQMKESFINDFKKIKKIMLWIESQQETIALKAQLREVLF